MKILKSNLILIGISLIFQIRIIETAKRNTFVATKLICQSNPSIVSSYSCSIDVVTRRKKVINLWCNFTQPIKAFYIDARLFKRYNGWQPHWIKLKFNFCDFLRGAKVNPLIKMFAPIFEKYTNMNHPCPYDHPLYLRNLDPSESDFIETHGTLIDSGRYKLDLHASTTNSTKLGFISFQGEIKEI